MFYLLKQEGSIPKRVELSKVIETLEKSNYVYTVKMEPPHRTYFNYDNLIKLSESISVDEAIENVIKEYSCKCTFKGTPAIYTYPNGDPGYPGDPPEYDLPTDEMYKEEFRYEYAVLLLNQLKKQERIYICKDPYSVEISNEDRDTLFEVADKAYENEYKSYPNNEKIFDLYFVDTTPCEEDCYGL